MIRSTFGFWKRWWAVSLGFAMVAGTHAASVPAVEAGTVVAAQGDTRLFRDGYLSNPLRVGATLYSGDTLMTGPASSVELRLTDKAQIALGASTEFKVDDYRFDANSQRSFLTLARGMMHQVSGLIGKRDHADYKLTTPTGTLGIRGTVFTVNQVVCKPGGCSREEKPGMAVEVTEGRVEVSNGSGAVEVPAGSAIHLSNAIEPAVFTAGPRAGKAAATATRQAMAEPAAAAATALGKPAVSAESRTSASASVSVPLPQSGAAPAERQEDGAQPVARRNASLVKEAAVTPARSQAGASTPAPARSDSKSGYSQFRIEIDRRPLP